MATESNRPTIGVASFRDLELLDACLDSVLAAAEREGARVVVARACSPEELGQLSQRYPGVTFLPAAPDASVPHLRGIALGAANGDVVALTEDHCVVCTDWLTGMLEECRDGADVVGGPMDNAQRARSIDWGAYFAEYGFFAERAARDGRAPMPTQANVAYAPSVAGSAAEWASQGLWENVAHDRLVADGRRFAFRTDAPAYQNKRYRFGAFCADRFSHGKDYGRRRLVDEGAHRRWMYLLATPVLPALLTVRVAQCASPRNRGAFVRALPFTVAFLTAWAIGEAAGYLSGPSRVGSKTDSETDVASGT